MVNRYLPLIPIFVGCLGGQCSATEPLRAGVAVVDITPPVPYRMSGYFSERLSTGVKDPLQAKAIVFQQGNEVGALVFCDLIGISRGLSDRARKRASRETGIPVPMIAIAATHTHTGPLYFGALREFFHDRMVSKQGTDPHEVIDYPRDLVAGVATAVRQAHASLEPVRIAASTTMPEGLAFNRRFHMKNGSVRFNPGQMNRDILRAAGPIDPQMGIVVLRPIEEPARRTAIVSFALHLDTVGGTEYSADYPKHLEDSLRRTFGKEFHCLFGTGTCGDINHIDVSVKGRPSSESIGRSLAASAELGIRTAVPLSDPALAVRSRTIRVPLQTHSAEEITTAAQNMELVDSGKLAFLERVKAYKIQALQLRGGREMAIEIQAFRLSSSVAIVTLPGEVFVELGLKIKAGSPFDTTLVIELTNDAPGYIPTQKAFVEGSYEVVNSRIAPGGGERMAETAVQLLQELAVEKTAH